MAAIPFADIGKSANFQTSVNQIHLPISVIRFTVIGNSAGFPLSVNQITDIGKSFKYIGNPVYSCQ